MTDETIRAKLSGIRCFLLDMDGTLYLGDDVFPGATASSPADWNFWMRWRKRGEPRAS